MTNQINDFRYVLILLFASTIMLNLGLGYLAYGLQLDTQPERINKLITKIESDEIEITKKLVLSQLSNFKQFTHASDSLVVGLQQLIAWIVITNIILVLTFVMWFWLIQKGYKAK